MGTVGWATPLPTRGHSKMGNAVAHPTSSSFSEVLIGACRQSIIGATIKSRRPTPPYSNGFVSACRTEWQLLENGACRKCLDRALLPSASTKACRRASVRAWQTCSAGGVGPPHTTSLPFSFDRVYSNWQQALVFYLHI